MNSNELLKIIEDMSAVLSASNFFQPPADSGIPAVALLKSAGCPEENIGRDADLIWFNVLGLGLSECRIEIDKHEKRRRMERWNEQPGHLPIRPIALYDVGWKIQEIAFSNNYPHSPDEADVVDVGRKKFKNVYEAFASMVGFYFEKLSADHLASVSESRIIEELKDD